MKCLTVWFNFMLFHIFDKAAVGVSREEKKNKISNMQSSDVTKLS